MRFEEPAGANDMPDVIKNNSHDNSTSAAAASSDIPLYSTVNKLRHNNVVASSSSPQHQRGATGYGAPQPRHVAARHSPRDYNATYERADELQRIYDQRSPAGCNMEQVGVRRNERNKWVEGLI